MRCLTCSNETGGARKKYCGNTAAKGTCAQLRGKFTTKRHYLANRKEQEEPEKEEKKGSRPAIGELGHHWRDEACNSGYVF